MTRITSSSLHRLVVLLGLGLSPQAGAATTDPETIIYRFPGVYDSGGASHTGVVTVFHCTNFSGATETVRFVVREFDSAIRTNATLELMHLQTKVAVTRPNDIYATMLNLNAGGLIEGTTAIAATSPHIICTAATIDAASTKPVGFALRGIRFNPVAGSQE